MIFVAMFHHHYKVRLIPRSLIYFAEFGSSGAEAYHPEEKGEAGAGVSEKAAEVAAEERRQAIAAAKQQKKEEGKVKKRDYKLASILQFFIHGRGKDDTMAILLTRLLQRNTPVSVLLAVLSLNFTEINEVLENYLEEEQSLLPDQAPEYLPNEKNLSIVQFGKELSEALSLWTKKIFIHASFHPMKTIAALAHFYGVDHQMLQLTSLVIQQFFEENKQEIEFDRIRQFSEFLWRDFLKKLHDLASERGLLPKPSNDPLTEVEE